jgi:glycosyltransferase involved in cell wall biosynthesis
VKKEQQVNRIPLISVVMSVYNGEAYLHDAIESILGQTLKNFEFIIIDDGSTDKTSDIINSYEDDRIVYIKQANHGLVYSLNKAVEQARSNIIARQDADDISLSNRLERQYSKIITNQKLGLVGTFFTYIDTENNPSVTLTFPTKDVDLKRSLYYVNPFGHGTVMFRKNEFVKAGRYVDTYGPTEDFELWRRMARNCTFAVIPETLYLYRINPEGISQTKNKVQATYTKKIIDEEWLKPFNYKPIREIIRGASYYSQLDSDFANEIHSHYVAQQERLALQLLSRGHLNMGARTAFATMILCRPLTKKLLKAVLSCVATKTRGKL